MRMRMRCDNPFCSRMFEGNKGKFKDNRYRFCKVCKKFHSYKVLVQQVVYQEPTVDRVIRIARDFRSPYVLADALEISPPTLYRWIRHYFRMSFGHFRMVYIRGKWDAWVHPTDLSEYSLAYFRVAPYFSQAGPDMLVLDTVGQGLPLSQRPLNAAPSNHGGIHG